MVPSKKISVVHLTHTDIRSDSRILKELSALSSTDDYDIYAFGVAAEGEAPYCSLEEKISMKNYSLLSNRTKWKPRLLRHFFTLIELFVKMFASALRASPKVIHCHDTLVLPIGWILSLMTGGKLVYDAHELESDKNGQNQALSKATLLAEKICWGRISLLVSVSPSIIHWYKENLGNKESVLVLNSPEVNQERKQQESGKYFHQHFDIPKEKLVFVYLGIFAPGRGLDLILEAFSNAQVESHVVFVGFGELEEQILKYDNSTQNIHLHPPVRHHEVVGLVESADVGLCFIENISLSDYYCLPNKLFEYAFAGLPVLSSSFPDLKNYIEKFELGVCADVNAQSVLEQVLKLEKQPLTRTECDLYEMSWPAQADRLTQAYKNLK